MGLVADWVNSISPAGWLPYVQKVLCSEGSMFRKYLFKRFYVQKVLYSEGSMFRRSYVQKVLISEGLMFRRSYVQKIFVQKILYSEGSMFRRSYIQIYSEGPIFRKFFVWCRKKFTSFSFRLTTMQDNKSQPLILAHSVKVQMKCNESGFRPALCTYRLNWARRTSWGWWDDWDDTVLQTQDSKFEPWRSEAEHATSRSRRLPTILTFTRGWGRNNSVSFKRPRPGTEPRTLAWKAAVLTTTLGPPPKFRWTFVMARCPLSVRPQ